MELVPALVPPKLPGRDPSVPYVAALCALIGVLCALRNCRKAEVRSAVPQIEMAYELSEDGQSGLLEQQFGGYVPPRV